ncbi:Hypothetical Protein FCC1311_066812 [Hondaea fermentalgiana]|uniref:Methyltransferase domain-containing protein n=1 Tax=Hondaea fermentalgiana TaxID=2315210 RepID=A0A2R5GHV4_9STRA|nr:Hypothetical Protein FCC1311_066812 [Hondaea fermentalgiana]|eukprot:GBG30462.1 Hypothetical Protein FCC1311_066812 [Hondaea fermentalgiana]
MEAKDPSPRSSDAKSLANEDDVNCFDWLVEFEEMSDLVAEAAEISHVPAMVSALVLGAGTSALSEALVNEGIVKSVLSLDVEQHCIDFMAQKHKDDDRLRWAVADVTDWHAVEAATQGQRFDMVVDKGTLDALLCAGDCAAYLGTVARAARCGGVLVLSMNFELVSSHLSEVLEWYHHEACPFLSADREKSIREAFASKVGSNMAAAQSDEVSSCAGERLSLRQTYDLLFTPEEKSCYSYEFFLQDTDASRQMREFDESMSLAESLTFLRINQ